MKKEWIMSDTDKSLRKRPQRNKRKLSSDTTEADDTSNKDEILTEDVKYHEPPDNYNQQQYQYQGE